jgi:hypothetical protein
MVEWNSKKAKKDRNLNFKSRKSDFKMGKLDENTNFYLLKFLENLNLSKLSESLPILGGKFELFI